VLVISACLFLFAAPLCILLGGAANMFFAPGFGQLHLFLALGKPLSLLIADLTIAMVA
jgi:hypothetical protein